MGPVNLYILESEDKWSNSCSTILFSWNCVSNWDLARNKSFNSVCKLLSSWDLDSNLALMSDILSCSEIVMVLGRNRNAIWENYIEICAAK